MVRTRYAPSPTGELHLGGLRTALYAWLHARHHQGTFFLRIEDTDQARLVPGSAERMMALLRTCGIPWDEGPDLGGPHAPYVQSERLAQYRAAAQQLLEQGSAYRCDCTPERLAALRDAQRQAKQPPRYDGYCHARTNVAVTGSVIRFRIPSEGGRCTVTDRIHGTITVDLATLDDFVLLKSDGFPTYHLAHVVDDHAMETTTVIRGDEWLPSLPKHSLLFNAFAWAVPEYAHLPLLMGTKGKLSKRDGDVSVEQFLRWCVPEALVNFVALLGWNPSATQEIYTRDTLIEQFNIGAVHASPARVNFTKLEWLNGEYIRAMDPITLADRIRERMDMGNVTPDFVLRAVELEQPRLKRLDAFPEWYFKPWHQDTHLAWKGTTTVLAKEHLRALAAMLTRMDPWPETPKACEEQVKAWVATQGWGSGEILWPFRVALSGQKVSPSPFELAWCFGKDETLQRVEYAIVHGT